MVRVRQVGGHPGTGADVDLTVGLLPCPSFPIHSCVWSRVWARSLGVGDAWRGCRKEENLVAISSPSLYNYVITPAFQDVGFYSWEEEGEPSSGRMWILSCRSVTSRKAVGKRCQGKWVSPEAIPSLPRGKV